MSAWRGEWENDISGNHMDSVQEQTLAVLARGVIVDNKHNRILLLQRRRHSLTEEDFRTVLAAERKSFWKERSESVQKLPFFFPHVRLTSQHRDSNSATNVNSDILRLVGSPVKSRRKVVERINCFTEGVYTIGLRVSGYRATDSTEELKIGAKLHRQVLQGHMAP